MQPTTSCKQRHNQPPPKKAQESISQQKTQQNAHTNASTPQAQLNPLQQGVSQKVQVSIPHISASQQKTQRNVGQVLVSIPQFGLTQIIQQKDQPRVSSQGPLLNFSRPNLAIIQNLNNRVVNRPFSFIRSSLLAHMKMQDLPQPPPGSNVQPFLPARAQSPQQGALPDILNATVSSSSFNNNNNNNSFNPFDVIPSTEVKLKDNSDSSLLANVDKAVPVPSPPPPPPQPAAAAAATTTSESAPAAQKDSGVSGRSLEPALTNAQPLEEGTQDYQTLLEEHFFVESNGVVPVPPNVLYGLLSDYGWGRFGFLKAKLNTNLTSRRLEIGAAEILGYALQKTGTDMELYLTGLMGPSAPADGLSVEFLIRYFNYNKKEIYSCKAIRDLFQGVSYMRLFLNFLFIVTKVQSAAANGVEFPAPDPNFGVPWWTSREYLAVVKEISRNGLNEAASSVQAEQSLPDAPKAQAIDLLRVLGSMVLDMTKDNPHRWTSDAVNAMVTYLKRRGLKGYDKDKTAYAKIAIIDMHFVGSLSAEMLVRFIDKSVCSVVPNPELCISKKSSFLIDEYINSEHLFKLYESFSFISNVERIVNDLQKFNRFMSFLTYPMEECSWWNDPKYDAYIVRDIAKTGLLYLALHAYVDPSSPFFGKFDVKVKFKESVPNEVYAFLYERKMFPAILKLASRYKAACARVDKGSVADALSDGCFCPVQELFSIPLKSLPDPKTLPGYDPNIVVIPKLPRNNKGAIEYPVRVSFDLTLVQPGRIEVGDERYHTEDYIYPVGYKSVRTIVSDFSEFKQVTCLIIRGATGPSFVVKEDDCYHVGPTPVEPWRYILYECGYSKSVITEKTGYDLFGLNDPSVIYLLQTLQYLDTCKKYIHKNITENKILGP